MKPTLIFSNSLGMIRIDRNTSEFLPVVCKNYFNITASVVLFYNFYQCTVTSNINRYVFILVRMLFFRSYPRFKFAISISTVSCFLFLI